MLTPFFGEKTQVFVLPTFLVDFNFLVTPLLEEGGPPTAPRVRKRPHEAVEYSHLTKVVKVNKGPIF